VRETCLKFLRSSDEAGSLRNAIQSGASCATTPRHHNTSNRPAPARVWWIRITAEIGWLRRLASINRRQRKKNDDIRLELNQMDTLVQKIQRRRLQWFGHVKRMNNSRLPAKALEMLISGTRSWGDKTRCGLTMSKRIYSKEEVICNRQQNVSKTGSTGSTLSMQPHRRQPAGKDGRVKERRTFVNVGM